MSSGTVCFTIEGEFLTDLCRSLVAEGRWRHALTTLTEGLRGISTDQALSILRGTHKLVGVNEVELLAEDRAREATEYLQLLAFQYAGLWHRPDGEWQPYANVTSFGAGDVPRGETAPGMYESLGRINRRWAEARARFYADNRKEDVITDESVLDHPTVLWRKVPDPPIWLRGAPSSAAALEEFLGKGRFLDERGGADADDAWAEAGRAKYAGDAARLRERGLEDEEVADLPGSAARLAETLGFTGKMAEAVEAIVGAEEDDSRPEPDPDLCSESGYILPDGAFYGCKYMHHPRLAKRLLRHLFSAEADDPEKEADRRNWLRIQARVDGGFSIMSPKGRPTKRQEITLASWCVAHLQPYPEDLK